MVRTRNKIEDDGYVYLLNCVGTPYYKIGKTGGLPSERAKAIGRTNPLEIIVLGSRFTRYMTLLEQYCHYQFHDRHHRYEWFVFDSPEEAVRLFNEKVDLFKKSKGKDEEDFEDNWFEEERIKLNFYFENGRPIEQWQS